MRSSSRRSSPISPHISPTSRLHLASISQVLDALDVSGNPLANEGVSALLLAHHALPAERPCRLRMEEVCVRPGSNLPLLLAKLSAGEPIEMQARSREIEREIAPPRIPHTTLRHAVRACPLLPPRCPSAYSRQRPGAPPPPTSSPTLQGRNGTQWTAKDRRDTLEPEAPRPPSWPDVSVVEEVRGPLAFPQSLLTFDS